MADLASQLEGLREPLMRYARKQLRNEAWAEDAVSETLLVALEKPQRFEGQSQIKTWLVGILKHKLVDQIRRHGREISASPEDDEDIDTLLFKADGHWREAPRSWGNPEADLGQRQFLEVLDACVDKLPGQQGQVFLMREWLELETAEICHQLGISSTNLFVLLHRARLRLRDCLQSTWFNRPATAR